MLKKSTILLSALMLAGVDVWAAGQWEMAQAIAPDEWMPAVVPGTVLTTLVRNGKVPDPYRGLNNKLEEGLIPDLSKNRAFYEATFRREVEIPASFANRVVWMRPEGINYRSEIYLNGHLAASTRGMFARNAVDVTAYVKPGARNALLVKVWPVDHPGTAMPKVWGAANGEWHNGGDGEIGRDVTMLMSAGWDFTFNDGIRDRNTGIWRDITFFATGKVRIDAPYVRTKLNGDMSAADLTLELDLHNSGNGWGSEAKGRIVAEVEGTDVRFEKSVSLFRGERRTEFLTARMEKPELWWPRNKGAQRLYTLRVKFVDAKTGAVSDEAKVRFGVREVTSDRSGKGGARQFYVNRRKVFIRGTNWIPEAMLKADDRRMEKEMRLTAESGVNLVRLWAGGIVESDRFYDLCDEYGLLVWQEFWMTGDTRHPDDPGLYLDNVAQQVKRIRAHASLAHWVASNESTEVAGTEELVKRLTGTTSWMMQSECDGVHDGSPYFPVNPMSYYEDTASPRGSRVYGFSPEYGTCALPAADQCRTFMPEELLWPVERNVAAWKYREGGGFDRMTMEHHRAVNEYGASRTFDDYCRKSQAVDALAHRALWETWNLARNQATGVLFWYNNTPIPQLGSHAWDYDLDQTASFFAQKNALEPLHVQYEYLSNRVSVVSDIPAAKRLTARAEVYDFESRKVWENEVKVKVEGEECRDAFTIPFSTSNSNSILPLSRPHFIKLRLLENEREIASTFYWRSSAAYKGAKTMTGPCVSGFQALEELPRTKLSVSCADGRVTVRNEGDRIAFMVRVDCLDKNGRRIVPVHFSDNYISLLPGEAQSISVESDAVVDSIRAQGWNTDPSEKAIVSVQAHEKTADLVIYGSSPAAVSAAIKATDMGLKAVIVSPARHVGGLSVSGLGFTDSGNTSAIGGLARDFYRRIYRAYQQPEAWTWQRREDFKAGGQDTKAMNHEEGTMWTFEPHIAERVFAEWMAERKVEVRRGEFLDREKGVVKRDGRIVSIRTLSGNTYSGRYFIDATYEGDLMAAAGVPYRVGREDCAEFGETWNGNQVGVLHHRHHFRDWKISPYRVPGDPSSGLCAEIDPAPPGVRGAGDRRVQAYCYRMCLTDDPRNRIPFAKPDGYDPARYELLGRCYAKGYAETFAKFDRIANHKTDTNNHGPLNADWLGGSTEWPEASYARRAELAKAHKDYQMGLYCYLSTDPAVPEDVRAAMAKWGLAKDEFADNGGWPYEIYVREGRRMIGEYTMTEHDCLGDRRHPAQGRAYGPVGMGSYCLDSHNVRRYVTAEGYVQNEGDIGVDPKAPYGIDYGAIVPRKADCENLLVPVALSATHTAFGSIRMEPVFMLLGESAATAAAFAARDGRAVQDIAYPELADRLRADGQVLDLQL